MSTTATLATYQMYIDGRRVEASSRQYFETENPYTGKPWALIARGTAEDVDRAVLAARKAFTSGDWPKLSPSRRGALLRKLGDLVAERSRALAEVEVRDNGKLYAEMSGQTAYMAPWFHYYGGLAVRRADHLHRRHEQHAHRPRCNVGLSTRTTSRCADRVLIADAVRTASGRVLVLSLITRLRRRADRKGRPPPAGPTRRGPTSSSPPTSRCLGGSPSASVRKTSRSEACAAVSWSSSEPWRCPDAALQCADVQQP
jgi:aldehyde dehydrogenase family protein